MVSGNRRQRRPVNAGRRQGLGTICAGWAEPRLVCGTCGTPQVVELCPLSGAERVDGLDGNIAVLRVHPRSCRLRRGR